MFLKLIKVIYTICELFMFSHFKEKNKLIDLNTNFILIIL